jgi:hypothetical protein
MPFVEVNEVNYRFVGPLAAAMGAAFIGAVATAIARPLDIPSTVALGAFGFSLIAGSTAIALENSRWNRWPEVRSLFVGAAGLFFHYAFELGIAFGVAAALGKLVIVVPEWWWERPRGKQQSTEYEDVESG